MPTPVSAHIHVDDNASEEAEIPTPVSAPTQSHVQPVISQVVNYDVGNIMQRTVLTEELSDHEKMKKSIVSFYSWEKLQLIHYSDHRQRKGETEKSVSLS